MISYPISYLISETSQWCVFTSLRRIRNITASSQKHYTCLLRLWNIIFLIIYHHLRIKKPWQMIGLFSIAVKLPFRIDWFLVRVSELTIPDYPDSCLDLIEVKHGCVFFLYAFTTHYISPANNTFFARHTISYTISYKISYTMSKKISYN